ncbi:MAG: proline--tRNA ligase [Clostridia bacterium]|nr:proline--tRNA ligase [Clostridia bacterium]
MKMSKLIGERFKDKPSDCNLISHEYLVRGGYIRHVTNGVYTLLAPALKVLHNIEKIVREEMDKIDAQEILMPNMMPKEMWQESGRYQSIGSEMFRFKDRNQKDMVLGMTHEEPCVDVARASATSYSQYPFCLYQIQTKFRDEPRPRNGLIRVREFVMKDAYSFHTSKEDLHAYYDKVKQAYYRIYARLGMGQAVAVEGDNGMMGGKISHEFTLLCPAGEDVIAHCDACGYYANSEVAHSIVKPSGKPQMPIKSIDTPNCFTVEDVCLITGNVPQDFAKAVIFGLKNGGHVIAFIRGDYDIEECKLANYCGSELIDADEKFLKKMHAGSVGLVGLDPNSKEYKIVVDKSLENEHNLVCGANKDGQHLVGVDFARDVNFNVEYVDIRKVKEGDACTCGKGVITLDKGVEIGNIFELDTKYTTTMNMKYIDSDGKSKTPYMGCYGIGITRAIPSIIEVNHDDKGIIWPMEVAPFKVHICVLNAKDKDMLTAGLELEEALKDAGIDVIVDDRKVSMGVMLSDADLLGAPIRIVVGRDFASSEAELIKKPVEISSKLLGFKTMVEFGDVYDFVMDKIKN